MTEIHIDTIHIKMQGTAAQANNLAEGLREALATSLQAQAPRLAQAQAGFQDRVVAGSVGRNSGATELAERITQAILKAAL